MLRSSGLSNHAALAEYGYHLEPSERVRVVEAEPVADLLEDLQADMFIIATGHSVTGEAGERADALLRALGRLADPGGSDE